MDMIEITGSLQRYIELRLMPFPMSWKDIEQKYNLQVPFVVDNFALLSLSETKNLYRSLECPIH